ncbi:MAG: hypothetical protein A3K31_08560 [Ignavibacteria bacterium RIFOXYA12_FULL_35_25]|nr:MAG: hypothetical protein A2058_13810 [Ignavibacteria bacterium GWA2_36_19]OGU62820.1 MAG: hypothetical protein A2X60_04565 [Ignavibacteria bacterium GWF2_35_20]OGU86087.1 MAG: hypothetical protein A3K31_08560 [Ignavibacteria bacterium RIFOXYA12_FULL_35_25]OGV29965.1 MAG: hypothetical protein A2523_01060 [Ignavibacteria bacterium RIFOXYD12_FULL_36_8]
MKWIELKSKVHQLLLSRNLSNPNIRLNALNNLEELFRKHFPDVISDPNVLLRYDKTNFKELVAKHKKLNSAESSVINNLYQFLEGSVTENSSIKVSDSIDEEETTINNQNDSNDNKLLPIAEVVVELLKEQFKIIPNYSLEITNTWLKNSPSKEIHATKWEEISKVYSDLVENKYALDKVLKDYSDQINYGSQRIDIWFNNPFNFAIEFDESQHFNQFRYSTLKHYSDTNCFSFDLELYKTTANSKVVKAGTSGFQKLKSFDPLFPEMLDGEKQNNRPRQRAFRDYLKDITPVLKGFNPTIRISYKTTNDNIKSFSETDIQCVRDYILSNKFLDKITLAK